MCRLPDYIIPINKIHFFQEIINSITGWVWWYDSHYSIFIAVGEQLVSWLWTYCLVHNQIKLKQMKAFVLIQILCNTLVERKNPKTTRELVTWQSKRQTEESCENSFKWSVEHLQYTNADQQMCETTKNCYQVIGTVTKEAYLGTTAARSIALNPC